MSKVNCWEFKNCGRELGGTQTDEFGVCPVSTEKRLHGIHDGINSGRACWVVAGTMCDGKRQGTFAQKYEDCQKCDFYVAVKQEEGLNFELSTVLINKLRPT
jgi:hypothetical protein